MIIKAYQTRENTSRLYAQYSSKVSGLDRSISDWEAKRVEAQRSGNSQRLREINATLRSLRGDRESAYRGMVENKQTLDYLNANSSSKVASQNKRERLASRELRSSEARSRGVVFTPKNKSEVGGYTSKNLQTGVVTNYASSGRILSQSQGARSSSPTVGYFREQQRFNASGVGGARRNSHIPISTGFAMRQDRVRGNEVTGSPLTSSQIEFVSGVSRPVVESKVVGSQGSSFFKGGFVDTETKLSSISPAQSQLLTRGSKEGESNSVESITYTKRTSTPSVLNVKARKAVKGTVLEGVGGGLQSGGTDLLLWGRAQQDRAVREGFNPSSWKSSGGGWSVKGVLNEGRYRLGSEVADVGGFASGYGSALLNRPEYAVTGAVVAGSLVFLTKSPKIASALFSSPSALRIAGGVGKVATATGYVGGALYGGSVAYNLAVTPQRERAGYLGGEAYGFTGAVMGGAVGGFVGDSAGAFAVKSKVVSLSGTVASPEAVSRAVRVSEVNGLPGESRWMVRSQTLKGGSLQGSGVKSQFASYGEGSWEPVWGKERVTPLSKFKPSSSEYYSASGVGSERVDVNAYGAPGASKVTEFSASRRWGISRVFTRVQIAEMSVGKSGSFRGTGTGNSKNWFESFSSAGVSFKSTSAGLVDPKAGLPVKWGGQEWFVSQHGKGSASAPKVDVFGTGKGGAIKFTGGSSSRLLGEVSETSSGGLKTSYRTSGAFKGSPGSSPVFVKEVFMEPLQGSPGGVLRGGGLSGIGGFSGVRGGLFTGLSRGNVRAPLPGLISSPVVNKVRVERKSPEFVFGGVGKATPVFKTNPKVVTDNGLSVPSLTPDKGFTFRDTTVKRPPVSPDWGFEPSPGEPPKLPPLMPGGFVSPFLGGGKGEEFFGGKSRGFVYAPSITGIFGNVEGGGSSLTSGFELRGIAVKRRRKRRSRK